MDNCIFCDRSKISEDILYESPNFFVKVGFALYSAGQVMLIPKKHYDCFGDLPDELEGEKQKLEDILMKEISRKFSEPFQVEMGKWGQSVKHAHTHFVPLVNRSSGNSYQIKRIIQEMVVLGGGEKIDYEEVSVSALKKIYHEEGGYVSIKQSGRLYVCHVKDIPLDPINLHPQLTLRGFFSKVKGISGVTSWREMSQEDKLIDNEKREQTKSKLFF